MKEVKVLIEKEALEKRIHEVAKQIADEYRGRRLTVICVLKGAVYFMTELTKYIENDMEVEFIRISSYEDSTESSGIIKFKLDLDSDITGKDVIVVEDILDTGRTLSYLMKHLSAKKPNSLKLCVLLDKKDRRICDVQADYVLFDIPNKFVVGYGLDFDEHYRNLPYVGFIEE